MQTILPHHSTWWYFKRMHSKIVHKCIAVLFPIVKNWKQFINNECINIIWYIGNMEYCSVIKQNWLVIPHYPYKHEYAKWKKANTEDILSDAIYVIV